MKISQNYQNKKIQVSLAEYPFDRYPPYISAGAILFSRQSIREIYYAIQHVRIFNFDDIYCGIIAYFLGLPVTHNIWMWYGYIKFFSEDYFKKIICAHGFSPREMQSTYDRWQSNAVH